MSFPDILSVPGYTGAGPDHWLTIWEKRGQPAIARVEQADWEDCDRIEWVKALDAAVAACTTAPFLVAHSLGCLTVAKWAATAGNAAAGAMLVAPADVDAPDTLEALKPFRPVPLIRLPFPALVIASADDPFCSLSRAQKFAVSWGAEFVNIGNAGHIATADGFGVWERGFGLLMRQLSATARSRSEFAGGPRATI